MKTFLTISLIIWMIYYFINNFNNHDRENNGTPHTM